MMDETESLVAARKTGGPITVGVGAAVFRDDAVLVVKRAHAPLKGDWSIPGGRLEPGETLRAAIHREVREETACTVEIVDFLNIYEILPSGNMGEDGAGDDARAHGHLLMVDFACRWTGGTVCAGDDAAAAAFLPMAEALDRVSWSMTRRAILLAEKIVSGAGAGAARPEEVERWS